eukprot:39846_1
MVFPTIFKHYREDDSRTKSRYKADIILTVIFAIILGSYAVISILDLLTRTTYEGICASDVTAKILCEEWSFRQCSYWGDSVGTKATDDGSNQPQMSKEDCLIQEGGGCPAFDITSPNFCTNYRGGNMLGEGVLYSYLWQGEMNQETVEFTEEASSSAYMCCGQIEQTIAQKLLIWLGVLGGTASVILKAVSVIPVDRCIKKETEPMQQVRVEGTEKV